MRDTTALHENNIDSQIFNYLTLIRKTDEKNKNGCYLWEFKCVCGRFIKKPLSDVKSCKLQSCGCKKNEIIAKKAVTHGFTKHPLYVVWKDMRARCYNPKDASYKNYGAKGITVCKEWNDNAKIFIEWALNMGWNKNLTIDRIDNTKGYGPNNCRLATVKEQANNRSSNRIVAYKGEKHTVIEWCEKLNLEPAFIYKRLNEGWSVEDTFEVPKHTIRSRKGLGIYIDGEYFPSVQEAAVSIGVKLTTLFYHIRKNPSCFFYNGHKIKLSGDVENGR